MQTLRVLGIDPGTLKLGWGIVDSNTSIEFTRTASGCLNLGTTSTHIAERLSSLHLQLRGILTEYSPNVVAIESAFFGDNARSALRIGEARGVVLMLAAEFGCEVVEIAPATVKRRVAGNGRASKKQVFEMSVQHLDCGYFEPATEDESDAVAISLCHHMERSLAKATSNKTHKKGAIIGGGRDKLPPGTTFQ
ncbi:MAG: crossover junction endodeoxyribonuclease RuvC [Planctomycetota bacterium]|nr:crossover junction endodeoxyribonuclease RuvC [Planctomycetota bacterium]